MNEKVKVALISGVCGLLAAAMPLWLAKRQAESDMRVMLIAAQAELQVLRSKNGEQDQDIRENRNDIDVLEKGQARIEGRLQ